MVCRGGAVTVWRNVLEGIELVQGGVYCVGSGEKFCVRILWWVVFVGGLLEKTRIKVKLKEVLVG